VGPMARSVEDCALAWSVLTGEPVPEPRLDGKRIGKLVRHPGLGERSEPAPADPRTDALPGEPVELPVPPADVWPVFYGEAAESHRATFPARAEEYGPIIRPKLERAVTTTPEALASARAAVEAWREAAREAPAVDVIVSPVLGLPDLPANDTPEHEFRIPFSAYARVYNFLGWPAFAIGDLQLAARDPRTLLEAALAWGP
jgi:Asp-tRNA(Asn)/Glu-tRNA(Gln) amidotransferase A subunit family amidase